VGVQKGIARIAKIAGIAKIENPQNPEPDQISPLIHN
jgi:hypothetical protein